VPFRRPRFNLVGLIYLVIGVAIASSHHYLSNIHGWRSVLSAILAIVLWPLILLGIDLHVTK
jgi:uncharacterized membrane protein YesL